MDRYELLKSLLLALSKISVDFRRANEFEKDDKSPVTELDVINQHICLEAIKNFYPMDNVIAEENLEDAFYQSCIKRHEGIIKNALANLDFCLNNSDQNEKCIWLIDPIDGTKGYLDNLCYSVAIAVLKGTETIYSGISSIGLDKILHTLPNTVIVCANDSVLEIFDKNKKDFQLPNSKREKLTIAISRKHKSGLLQKNLQRSGYNLIEIDSQAKYLSLVLDLADAYIREKGSCGTNQDFAWDHLPGIHINKIAGGVTLDKLGREPCLSSNMFTIEFVDLLISAKSLDVYRDLLKLS